jgi:HEAT repeat protein
MSRAHRKSRPETGCPVDNCFSGDHVASGATADLLDRLGGGDRRSIGRVHEVVAAVEADPALFDCLVQALLDGNPLIRMRSADALEKITRRHPEYLRPYRALLLGSAAAVDQKEVRWHIAQMIPRLELSHSDVLRAKAILLGYLRDPSRIVKTEAMQALAHLAELDATLREEVVSLIEQLVSAGSPAMRSRGRRLLARLAHRASGPPGGK